MPWQLLTGIAVASSSAVIPLQRLLLHKHKSDPIAFVIVSQLLTAVLIASYAIVHGVHLPDFSKYGYVIAAMFALYSTGHLVYAHTLKRVEASIFSTLLNTNLIWIMLAGFVVFNERPGVVGLLGAVLVLVSVGMLAERSGTLKLDKGLWMGLLVGLIFGVAQSAWIYVGKNSDIVTWTALSFAVTPLILLLASPSSVQKMKPFLRNKVPIWLSLLAALWGASNLASLAAYRSGNVTLIAPLLQTNVVVTVLIGIIFLRERTRFWKKMLAAVVCLAGVLLIVG